MQVKVKTFDRKCVGVDDKVKAAYAVWRRDLGSVGLSVQTDIASVLLAGKRVIQNYAKVTDGIGIAGVVHKLAELDGARWYSWLQHPSKKRTRPENFVLGSYTHVVKLSVTRFPALVPSITP
jgi:hypothetical protein